MERDPPHIVGEDEAGGNEELGKGIGVYPMFKVLLEVDASCCEQIYRLSRKHIVAVFRAWISRGNIKPGTK